jgi:CDP-diacylglycerol--glycerol-3-phosphate 3-phosphatidyltransferase
VKSYRKEAEFMSKSCKFLIPNVITCIRIVLSFFLFMIKPQTIGFFSIYIICGMTDICDGYLARKWKVTSKFGALLDSIADLIFVIVLLLIFIPILELL